MQGESGEHEMSNSIPKSEAVDYVLDNHYELVRDEVLDDFFTRKLKKFNLDSVKRIGVENNTPLFSVKLSSTLTLEELQKVFLNGEEE